MEGVITMLMVLTVIQAVNCLCLDHKLNKANKNIDEMKKEEEK